MARSSRSWSDLSPQERQRATVGLGVVGLALVAIAVFVLTTGGDKGAANAAEINTTPTVSGSVTLWYDGTAELRGEVINRAEAVRAFVEATDGIQLQPACTALAEQAAKAVAYQPAPDAEVQKLWSDGATGFADAASTCGTLWALPTEPPSAILARVTTALDQADQAWADLAELAGEPLPDIPTGTIAPGRPATSKPSATPSAGPTTPVPGVSSPAPLPSISIGPLFDTSSPASGTSGPTSTPLATAATP